MSAKRQLVVIGNGMAPGRMLEKVLEVAPEKFDITIFNAEPRVNYCLLYTSPSPRDGLLSRMPSSA